MSGRAISTRACPERSPTGALQGVPGAIRPASAWCPRLRGSQPVTGQDGGACRGMAVVQSRPRHRSTSSRLRRRGWEAFATDRMAPSPGRPNGRAGQCDGGKRRTRATAVVHPAQPAIRRRRLGAVDGAPPRVGINAPRSVAAKKAIARGKGPRCGREPGPPAHSRERDRALCRSHACHLARTLHPCPGAGLAARHNIALRSSKSPPLAFRQRVPSHTVTREGSIHG